MITETAKCPSCKIQLLDELHEYFTNNCSSVFFDFKCPNCKKNIEVNIKSIPVFSCSIKSKKFDTVGVGLLL